jgi:hypothetical protein
MMLLWEQILLPPDEIWRVRVQIILSGNGRLLLSRQLE